jgi:hypothetical protein
MTVMTRVVFINVPVSHPGEERLGRKACAPAPMAEEGVVPPRLENLQAQTHAWDEKGQLSGSGKHGRCLARSASSHWLHRLVTREARG